MVTSDGPITYQGIPWIRYHGALVPDVAPHVPVALTDQEATELLRLSGARFLRWHTDFDAEHEWAFWHVIKDGPADLGDLSKNTRNQIRKGLKNGTVERTSATDLAREGFRVYRRAMRSYDTDLNPLSEAEFTRRMEHLDDRPEYEMWGVRNAAGDLIAYAQNKLQDDTCNYQVIKLDPAHLKLYPGYALLYRMNDHYLNDRAVRYVNDGARSIRHTTGIQDFLIRKFGFRRAYGRLHLVYDRKVALLVRATYGTRALWRKIPLPVARKLAALHLQEEIHRRCTEDQSGGSRREIR